MKILVPLDGSKFSEAVLGPVAKLVAETKAEVHLLGVVSGDAIHASRTGDHIPEAGAQSYYESLGGWRSRFDEGPGHPIAIETRDQALERDVQGKVDYLSNVARVIQAQEMKTKVITGEQVAEEIQSYAHREGIDIIALTTHGRTGLANIMSGSVAMDLLHKGETPLLLVRSHDLIS